MQCFVVVTFDLEDPDPQYYEDLNSKIKDIGLKDKLQGKKGKVELPTTTFAGKLNSESISSLRDSVRERVKEAFDNVGVKGKIFVTVAEDSKKTWGTAKV